MRTLLKTAGWLCAVFAVGLVGVGDVFAQTSVCASQPYLGTNGPELCVNIYDDGTGASVDLRGPSPIFINRTIGDYRLNLVVSFVVGAGGLGVNIEGPVWRTSPGTGWITVRADGGTDAGVPASSGSLVLDGTATAASGTQLGGGAGFRTPGGDVAFTGYGPTCDETTLGAGAFHCEISEIPVNEGAVAVTNITGFHVNNVGDTIEIPSGVRVGAADFSALPKGRHWNHIVVLFPDQLPVENAVAPLTNDPEPELIGANITYDATANYLNVFRLRPPYAPTDVIDHGTVDSGFLFSASGFCSTEDNHAFLPYIKTDPEGANVYTAEYRNGPLTISRISATIPKDYYSASCFTAANRLYLTAYNNSDHTIDLFRRSAGGEFLPWMTLGASDFGGTPEAPFLAAVGKAAGRQWWGQIDFDGAVISAGLADGTLVVGELRTDTAELTKVWNLGSAMGETSLDLVFDEVKQCRKWSANWIGGDGVFRHTDYCWGDTLGAPHVIRLGRVGTGSLFPDFQGVDGGSTSDGYHYALADKGYVIDPAGLVTEMPDYPFLNLGGPVHFTVLGDPVTIRATAAGPGSQLIGFLSPPEVVNEFAVPAVARVRGAGAFFTSIMHLFNKGAVDLELEMTFTPREGSGGAVTTVNHTVPAGVMQTIEDPLEALFGFGGGAGRVGSVLIKVTSGSASSLMAQTVVFARLDSDEEYGQFFPALRIGDAITAGQKVYLNTTEDPVTNRVNIGLMAVENGTRFRVTPVDPLGSGLAAPMNFDLDTGGNTQINNLHSSFGLGSAADVVVEVEALAGSGFSYASVLDGNVAYSGTSDPTTILPSLDGSAKVTLLEIGSIQGLNEFSGSASITNYSNRSASVKAFFFQRDEPGVRASENLTIAAGDTVGYTDLGAELFDVSGDVGTVVLTTTNNTRIGATGREFAIFRNPQNQVVGTAGQLIAGQTDDELLEAGQTHHFIGLRQRGGASGVERSHFAVFNPGWGEAEITVRLYDGSSGAFEGERSWIVGGRTLIQVNNVIRSINPDQDGSEKRIEVEVDRDVFMNAFRVNPWGDPITLSPFRD